jgi:hypothetical protein
MIKIFLLSIPALFLSLSSFCSDLLKSSDFNTDIHNVLSISYDHSKISSVNEEPFKGTYIENDSSFSITFPEAMYIVDNNSETKIKARNKEDYEDYAITISYEKMKEEVDLVEFGQLVIATVKEGMKGVKIAQQGTYSGSKYEAYYADLVVKKNDRALRFVYMKKGKVIVTFLVASSIDYFKAHDGLFRKTVNSFQLL